METRASYILVGSFVLAMFAGLLVFTIWVAKIQLQDVREIYHIYFTGSVTGLQQGSAVRYRGIPVGTVTDIRLDPENVTRVRTTVELQPGTPVKTDSIASLEVQGITGGAYVQISGGSSMSERLGGTDNDIPVIPSRPSTLAEVVDTAPQLLARAMEITERLSDILNPTNRMALSSTLANAQEMTAHLARAATSLERTMEDARGLIGSLNNGVGPKLEDTLLQARQTLATLDTATKSMSGDVKELSQAFKQTATQVNGLIAENREPVRDFTASGLYELTLLITQFRDLSGQLSRVITRIENDPSNFLFGGTKQGVEVRGR